MKRVIIDCMGDIPSDATEFMGFELVKKDPVKKTLSLEVEKELIDLRLSLSPGQVWFDGMDTKTIKKIVDYNVYFEEDQPFTSWHIRNFKNWKQIK